MRYVTRGWFFAVLVLMAWLLPAGRFARSAQEAFPDRDGRPAEIGAPGEFLRQARPAAERGWGAPDADSSTSAETLSWTQRIAGLARGRTQLEGGYSYLRDSTGAASGTQHAFPDLLLRIGLTNRLELRVGWPGYVSNEFDDPTLGDWYSGTLDPNVGVAYDMWSQHGFVPQTAVLIAIPVSLEGNPFALSSLQPLTELMYAWQLGERTSVTGRSGLALYDAAGDHYAQLQQGLSLDGVLTERVGAFLSWDMLANHGSWDDTAQHMAGSGLSFLLTDRLIISGRAAVGLNSVAPDFLSDIRFAYRF